MAWYLLLEYTIWGRRGSSESFGKTPGLPCIQRDTKQCNRMCCSLDAQLGNYEATTPKCYTTLPLEHGHFFAAPPLLAVSLSPPRSLCVSLSDTLKMAQLPLQTCLLSLMYHSA